MAILINGPALADDLYADAPPANAAPHAVADTYQVLAGSTHIAAVQGVLANDTDPEGDALTASLHYKAAYGAVTLNADGSFDYTTYDPRYTGPDRFTYYALDGKGGVSEIAVSLDVTAPAVPIARADTYTVQHTGSLSVDYAHGVLANDTDPLGGNPVDGTFEAMHVFRPGHGELLMLTGGRFIYTPYDPDYTGSDTFVYYAMNAAGASAETLVTLNMAPTNGNAAPVAYADVYNSPVNDGTAPVHYLSVDAAHGVLANDTDADGDALAVRLNYQTSYGRVFLQADGSFEYVPFNGFTGTDQFIYTVDDGQADSRQTLVTLHVGDFLV